MNWKVIRLELASSREFPRGSAGRSYLIRLPLTDEGAIDPVSLETEPARATVRRYWPNQADMSGHLVRTPSGFAILYEASGATLTGVAAANGSTHDKLFSFCAQAINVGEEIRLTEPDGHETRFRIARMQ